MRSMGSLIICIRVVIYIHVNSTYRKVTGLGTNFFNGFFVICQDATSSDRSFCGPFTSSKLIAFQERLGTVQAFPLCT